MTQEISVIVADREPIIVGMAMLVAKVSVACIAPAGMIASATRNRRPGDSSSSSAVVVAVIVFRSRSEAVGVPSESPDDGYRPSAYRCEIETPSLPQSRQQGESEPIR